MSLFKLQSSDGETIKVNGDIVKQMLTIQTMIDDLGDQDDDELIPIPAVNIEVLKMIIRWIERHKDETEKENLALWQNDFFDDLSVTMIMNIILGADYLNVKSLLNESCRMILSTRNIDEDVENFDSSRVSAILEEFRFDVIVTAFGDRELVYFNPKTKSWVEITEIPEQFLHPSYKLIGAQGRLYLVGGIGCSSGNLTEYNPRTGSWRSVGSIGRLVKHSVCSLGTSIYIASGAGQITKLFKLDAMTDFTDEIALTYNLHEDHVTVFMNDKVYVIGGCFVGVHKAFNAGICKAFNVKQGGWESLADLPTPRTKAAGAVHDNKIYVAGGYHYGKKLQSVFCYDPVSNTWTEVASMNKRRRGHSLVNLDGLLYAIGGGNDDEGFLDNMEMYNPDTNTWEMLEEKLNGIVDGAGAFVMPRYYFQ